MTAPGPATWLFVAALAIYLVGRYVAAHYLVEDRWFERQSYDADGLKKWVQTDARRAARYAFPVLFPIDLLFMLALGAWLAVASKALAEGMGLPGMLVGLVVLVPALYVVVDLAEDALLAWLFVTPDAISAATVGVTRALTRIKMGTLILAGLQTLVLAVAATVLRCR